MKHISQPLLQFIYKHPKFFDFLLKHNQKIENNIFELGEFEFEPSLNDLENFVFSKDFQNCMYEMYLYTCSS
jgi:hypothetical protein